MEQSQSADVGLLLEGTYPYVLGGVSAWVDQLIRGLPDLTFAAFFIGGRRETNEKLLYQLPPNVVNLTEIYLHDRLPDSELRPARTAPSVRSKVYEALFRFYLAPEMAERAREFWRVVDALKEAHGQFTFGNLCRDPEAWELLKEVYNHCLPEESFIDFFWTVRFLHLPLWQLWRSLRTVPPARVYHTVSAGYAGLMGALASRRRDVPLLMTEHGIYAKERIAEISQAEWIYEAESNFINFSEGLGKLKQMWINLFILLGQLAYDTASQILTLFEGNALTQMEFGADGKKIQVVPNGIEPANFNAVRDQILARFQTAPLVKTIGFIGRVVPIKDVKTLLRAARLVCEKCPQAVFLIAGPTTEDPAYFAECQKITKLLAIEDKVLFLGVQKLMEVLPRMDILVLTSISEGLPLVALEAMAAGIPVVATDVGACRELIFGRVPADKAIGRAGRLTKILSPQETANALIAILKSPDLWRKTGAAGRLRVEKHYSMANMLRSYRELYYNNLSPPWQASALN